MVQKKKQSSSITERKKEVLSDLSVLGLKVYDQIDKGDFPAIDMPSRSTENITFDPQLRQFILGDRAVRRSSRNIRHLKPFTQLLWAAFFCDLMIEYTVPGYEGKTLNLDSHPDGVLIGPALTSSEFVKTTADKVIAIEKGGLFTRFIEEKVHKKYNALLVMTAGQAPRATRHFIRRLNNELKLPVYIFTDGDPWGMHIAQVIISGSANAAHLRDLTTPDAKWSGVWATDIVNYKLPTDPLDEMDMKRLYELQKDPSYKEDPLWQREIKTFMKIKRKAEQEAFSRYGLTYIVDEYLPAKLEETK